MTIGYVHFGGHMGDLVRVDVIRRFLTEHGLPFKEFRLRHDRPSVDMVREVLSPKGVRHLARKIFVDRSHRLLQEIHWSIEARQWEASIDREWAAAREELAELEILHAETMFAGMVCLRALEANKTPFVYDMHGILREEARLSGSSEWQAWCERWERRVVVAAAHVLVVSPLMADYVRTVYGVPDERIVLVPNGAYPSTRRAQYASPLTVVYAGNMAPFENMMEVVKAAEIASVSYRFWLLGDGPLRNEVFDYVNSRFVDLVYWGRKPREAALDRCALAQVGFSGQAGALDLEKDYPRQLGCPIKIFDYAACGLPVVLPPGEWAPVIDGADCGVVAKGADAASLAAAIRELEDPTVWARKSRNARELIASTYNWDKVLAPLASIYGRS